jgi:mono/diheme cytochrome c family protein
MKKLLLPVLALLSALLVAAPVSAEGTSASTASLDGLQVTGKKELTRELGEGDELVQKHCTGCHTEGRIMTALEAMRSDQPEKFESQLKSIISHKIRLTNGEISRQDGKKIMNYLGTIWQRQKPLATNSTPVSPGSATLSGLKAAPRTLARPS